MKGPGIGGENYSTRVYYFVIIILRQFIRHYAQAKDVIIKSPSLKIIIDMLKPENLHKTQPQFEIKIYQFLIQLVKEDMDKKAEVGRIIFEDVFKKRLELITDSGTNTANSGIALF